MKCEHFENLIPLYVGGDLEPPQADDLRQHLTGCAHCRRVTEDFQASQTWLTGFAVPEFDEASFATMRASVISQIERQEKRGRLIEWLLPKFSPRFVLASAAIALAIVSGLVAAVYRQQPSPSRIGGEVIADNGSHRNQAAGDGKVITAGGQISTTTGKERRFPRSKRADSTLLPPEAFNNGGFSNPLEPPVIPDEQPVTEPAPATEPEEKEMLRIELQTADPNIRIIWLTPKTPSPTDSKTK